MEDPSQLSYRRPKHTLNEAIGRLHEEKHKPGDPLDVSLTLSPFFAWGMAPRLSFRDPSELTVVTLHDIYEMFGELWDGLRIADWVLDQLPGVLLPNKGLSGEEIAKRSELIQLGYTWSHRGPGVVKVELNKTSHMLVCQSLHVEGSPQFAVDCRRLKNDGRVCDPYSGRWFTAAELK